MAAKPTPPSPPDDLPLTWGEFRRAVKALSHYHAYLTLYSTVGLSSAIGSRVADERLGEIERHSKDAARAVKELAGFDPGDLDG